MKCWDMVIQSHVEIYLRNWVFFPLRRNTYFPYYCLYRIIKLLFFIKYWFSYYCHQTKSRLTRKCAWWSAERSTVCGKWRFCACSGGEESREQTIHHFVTFPAFSTNSTTITRSKKKRGLRCRQHHSTMQDTKTGALLRQVSRQWWKLYQ
jgi:hypothetical protein